MSVFNERLKELIKENGLSQAELGRITNIPRTTVADYINQKSTPKHDNLNKLAKALNADVEYLTGKSEIKKKDEEYIEYLVSNYADLNEMINEIDGDDIVLINNCVQYIVYTQKYDDRPFKDIVQMSMSLNDESLNEVRNFVKWKLDNQ